MSKLFTPPIRGWRYYSGALVFALLLQACSGEQPVEPSRYAATDRVVEAMTRNIDQQPELQLVADIDHSRLGHEAGSPMPPSRVLIFSDARLETDLIRENPLAALEMPLRILAFEAGDRASANVIYNGFDYLVSRYQLGGERVPALASRYQSSLEAALADLPAATRVEFPNNSMQPDGIVTLASPYGFEETLARVNAAIDAQDDTVHFGTVDFQANARALGEDIRPAYMILFGGPGPGGQAMARSPTLGLDGFCQKFLVWQDEAGKTYLSFNDLIALAHRQEVSIPLILRVIDFRLNSVFEEALSPE